MDKPPSKFTPPPKFETKALKLIKNPGDEALNDGAVYLQTGQATPPGMAKVDGGGEVRVTQFINPDKSVFFLVELYSINKKHLISRRNVDASGKNETQIRTEIRYTGGALAEYQAAQYDDRHDTTDVADRAGEAFDELLAELKQAKN